ncbi:MAG: isoquinoline 1-oxidoreductase beta subunit [Phenylobacterium sp.]|jgi:isoquinoline 1-oxidoreductase beta subunit
MNFDALLPQNIAAEAETVTDSHPSIENLSRRRFVKGFGAVGGSLLLGIQLPSMPAMAANATAASFNPDVFISMAADGLVTIISHRSEMGQGIRSTLPLLIADEMEADWDRVKIEQADGDEKYGSQNTDGSRSVRKNYHRLRLVGATARTMLQQAAAQLWGVLAQDCEVYNHQVSHKASGKVADFAQLVQIASQLAIPTPQDVTLKSDDQLRYISKDNIKLVDGQDIVTGKAIYSFDVELEGQKYAVIARPPVLFGTIKSFDAEATLKVPGVLRVIELKSSTAPTLFKPLGGLAVIADNSWAAIKGREKLIIDWAHGDNAAHSTKTHEAVFAKALDESPHTIRQRGNWQQAQAQAAQTLNAEYYTPGLSHSMMEPPAATARMTHDGIEVWGCVQTPQRAKSVVAQTLGLKPEHVTIHVTLLGGGFGRKSKPDFMAEAALLALKTHWPIKMIWTREDEIRHGYYHAPGLHRVSAAIDAQGKTSGWDHTMVMHPIGSTFNPAANRTGGENDLGFADMPFDIANIQHRTGETNTFQRIGWMRSVANISNAFAVSSFADEIAHQLKQDPKDHLLALIGKDQQLDFTSEGYKYGNYGEPLADFPVDTARLKNVIKLVADKAGWGRKLPKGHGLGIAAHRSFCSYVATVVEVSMKDGRVTIERVDCAVDCGKILNPDQAKAQMEGAAVFAASYTLFGEITLTDGIVDQGNFDDYPLARIGDIPATYTHLVDSQEKPAGIGEPGVPPFAPALCNAIFAASGQRYRRLPLSQFGIV